ncbi:hypothetical protein H1D32_01015 [Anaerobacillus sp. CMMVII]|uniref:hypothetical protein n=1 Tax=Anaerobacillus sp. CMMVII TaxID=2755588 RepID=UPI0021B727EA|nr:hypothetical protein [Anaerobacillus sp. CMMVII]MCT8136476.1 hypothetical protein [Anaerobacillus sp. CMMVII]
MAVKIQQQNETLEEAKIKLLQASKKKGCSLLVLIRTTTNDTLPLQLEPNQNDDNILIIDSYHLLINDYINSKDLVFI